MVSLSALQIRLFVVYSLGSLHIWQIILKSELFAFVYLELRLMLCVLKRVLMACIRNLGNYPCPRCLITKEQINGLGTVVDGKRRAKLRQWTEKYQVNIEHARRIIYQYGYVVNSKAVDTIIGNESLTPTRVS